VAGAAALVIAARPGVDPAQALVSTARPIAGASTGFGAGVVDPAAAVSGGCVVACGPPAEAEEETFTVAQSVRTPTKVRVNRRKLLPSVSDLGVEVKRWRSKSPAKCRVERSRLFNEWWVRGRGRGVCRLRVVIPQEQGIERLKQTQRLRVLGAGGKRRGANA
jgi:hypothetical protein